MDFAKLDLRETADNQFWVHLRVNDVYLYAGEGNEKPCRVRVASITDPGVETALKAVERAGRSSAAFESQLSTANREQRKALESRADAAEVAAQRCITQFLTTVVKDWENIEIDGKPLEFSQEALVDMSQPKAPMFRLATAISKDMAELYDPFGLADSA